MQPYTINPAQRLAQAAGFDHAHQLLAAIHHLPNEARPFKGAFAALIKSLATLEQMKFVIVEGNIFLVGSSGELKALQAIPAQMGTLADVFSKPTAEGTFLKDYLNLGGWVKNAAATIAASSDLLEGISIGTATTPEFTQATLDALKGEKVEATSASYTVVPSPLACAYA